MPLPSPEAVATIVAEVAAEEIVPRFGHLRADEVSDKNPGDPVTVADVAAEKALSRRLKDLLPGSVVVGEEAVEADAGLLDLLKGDDPVWIIDPVDGTTNFAAGLPLFATIIGLARKGEMLLACLHDPIHRKTALACAGDGATLNGEACRVAAPSEPKNMYGTVKLRFGERGLPETIIKNCQNVPPFIDLRCAAVEYMALATGALHYALYRKLKPWDHAAGNLLHTEAGGFSAHLDGGPYAVTGPDISHGFLSAPDESSWHALVEALTGD
ncbi:MAG: inositol monophosphatase [Alphaproteobacteria bacterium]|jgi:fructose-1,6-bisphosphatase/inositol monophosphatase family enzyme|nr:inositol monophosphatase [Rhodospirillaceae bacterium]MBT6511007.1 inositol monophosphatase [Rhodospirillaceae bacterium]MDG2479402.1 inositol monophosphatase [Alphaproteobacteria bacterium]